jgi:putative oxidoreductase
MSFVVGSMLLRILLGVAFATHGAQKLFGWFGGHGLAGTGGFFAALGFRPGTAFAAAAGFSELVGGLLLAFGFLGAVGPALVLATMLVAALTVHVKNGFFAQNNGFELPFLYAVGALSYAFAGFGPASLDSALGITLFATPAATWVVLAVGALGGLGALAVRHRAPQEAPAA